VTVLLAGDIGGTKSNLAIYSTDRGPKAPLAAATFLSPEYPSLEALVGEFLAHVGLQVDRASFGVAGPVVAGEATVTNLPWIINEAQLQKALDLSSVRLLNDLAAIASAVPFLEAAELHTLNEGQPVPNGALAVIAPGTGLGEAFLVWCGSRYIALPSEGGHGDFAPSDPLEIELLRYLWDRLDHVSFERVCSGRGLPNIYAFLKDSGLGEEPQWLAKQLAQAGDPNPIITRAALGKKCELCVATLDIFVSILGAEAGNLALKVMATGGVYLGGGIPPKILPALQNGQFMASFTKKGRLAGVFADVPVHVILNPKAALLGTACYGLEL
jgi:glucokinase